MLLGGWANTGSGLLSAGGIKQPLYDQWRQEQGIGSSLLPVLIATIVLNITNSTAAKLSHINGYTRSTVTFRSNKPLTSWEARATTTLQTPGVGVGLLVGSGGAETANTDITFDVDDTELTAGDGVYTVSVYGA